MKKIIYLLGFMLTVSIITSCTNEDISSSNDLRVERTQNDYDTEFARLKQEMDRLGINAYGDRYYNPQSRSWFHKFYKFVVSVVTTDVSTGLVATSLSGGNTVLGGTIGVLCSIWAGFNQDGFSDPNFARRRFVQGIGNTTNNDSIQYFSKRDSVLKDLIIPHFDGLPVKSIDSIGYIHNKVILDLYDDHPEMFTAGKLYNKDFVDSVSLRVGKVLNLDSSSVSNEINSYPELMNSCYTIRGTIQGGPSLETAVSNIQAMFPEYSSQFEIINTFIETLNIDTDDNEDENEVNEAPYIFQVFSLIDNSSLPDNIKESLRSGLLIANASQKLWSSGIVFPKTKVYQP